MFRIGQSTDIHQIEEGRKLILGGVEIDSPFGLKGHSDADVLLHAITEAIIGALGKGDIGTHFPDTDPKYKGIDSSILLKETIELMEHEGYEIGNIDSLIMAEKPKLSQYKKKMEKSIANICNVDINQINVKATRGEKLGFIGRGEGMQAQAIVLLVQSRQKK
ncbi:MAG: 2-C-methyl-D-erythritol 2,4-cyclodiphosphate synthase [Culicoidibacterales bacterium]